MLATKKNLYEACGILAMVNAENVSLLGALGLFALQHRGEEACGLASTDGTKIFIQKGFGKVSDVIQGESLSQLKGNMAIGHTSDDLPRGKITDDLQPFVVYDKKGDFICVAHNGALVNRKQVREYLNSLGVTLAGITDSELFAHLIATCDASTWEEKITFACKKVEGSYALAILTKDAVFGVRDPHGIRPLCLGQTMLNKAGSGTFILASETAALDVIGASYISEVEAGEIIKISCQGNPQRWVAKLDEKPLQRCIFELMYFARANSKVFGISVYQYRKALGKQLAKEAPAQVDMIVPVPDSGLISGLGFAQESGIPYELGIHRSPYIGRSFIQPNQELREMIARLKLCPNPTVLRGKSIALIDDSIVRGTTTRNRISLLRGAGVKEIHVRIACPQFMFPCYYGLSIPERDELISVMMDQDLHRIAEFLCVDSVQFLSLKGAISCGDGKGFYHGYFSGEYPTKIPSDLLSDVIV